MLSPRDVLANIGFVEFEARDMICNLLIDGKGGKRPLDPTPYAYRAVLNNILQRIYGVRTEATDAVIVAEVHRMSLEFMCVLFSRPLTFQKYSDYPLTHYIL